MPSPSPRRRQIQNSSSATTCPLVVLGLLVIGMTIFTFYTNHVHQVTTMQTLEQLHKFRFESTTYHSSQRAPRLYKRIHRNEMGQETEVELVQDEPLQKDSTKKTKLRISPRKNMEQDEWPAPRLTNESTVFLVLSARNHIELRQVIRETWGNGHDNLYFVIGQYCPVNHGHRKHELTCEDMPGDSTDKNNNVHDEWYEKRMKLESQVLREEQEHYRDMLWTPSPESYRGLPHKIKEGYDWVVRNLPNTKWIVKSDDDTIVRVASLSHYLETTPSLVYTKPTIIGKIEYDGDVHQEGRWKETKYPGHTKYPPFPLGSCGHVVSRPVAEYIAKHKSQLTEYQGEDTSIAIWMHESPLKVEVMHSDSFENDGKCENPNLFIIGHDLPIDKIRDCFKIGDEVQPI